MDRIGVGRRHRYDLVCTGPAVRQPIPRPVALVFARGRVADPRALDGARFVAPGSVVADSGVDSRPRQSASLFGERQCPHRTRPTVPI